MPFKSKAQRRKFAQLLVEGKISDEVYEEWNRSTGRKELPERLRPATAAKRPGKAKGAATKAPRAAAKARRAGRKTKRAVKNTSRGVAKASPAKPRRRRPS